MPAMRTGSTILRALSIRQPYAELILQGKKQIEYRSTNSLIRERVYIYASKTEVDDATLWRKAGVSRGKLPLGVLVGSVEITGSRYDEDEDQFEWQLARPERFARPLPVLNHAQPGIWRPQLDPAG